VCRHPRAAPSAHAPACCLSLNPTEAASRSQAARGRPIRTGWVHGTIGRRCPWRRVATRRAPVGRGGQLAFVSLSRAWPPAQGSPRFRAHMMMMPRRGLPLPLALSLSRYKSAVLVLAFFTLSLSPPQLWNASQRRAHIPIGNPPRASPKSHATSSGPARAREPDSRRAVAQPPPTDTQPCEVAAA
jgi:hypothetical protein